MKNIWLYVNYDGSDKILEDMRSILSQLLKNNKFCNCQFIPAHHKHYIRF